MELMAKLKPVLLDDFDQTLYCPVIWVQQMLRQTAQLGCSVPAIGTMDDDVLLLHEDFLDYLVHSFQNDREQLHVASGLHGWTIRHDRVEICGHLRQSCQSVECLCDSMDVVDTTECEFAVRVVSFVFKTATFELIGLSTQSWSSIVNRYRRIRV